MKRIFMILLMIPLVCKADWFGPKNYEDCILEGMKGTTSDMAAMEIKKACRAKFPLKQSEEIALTDKELASISDLSRLEKTKRFNPEYNYIVHLHNNTAKQITGAKIMVVAGNGEFLYYKVTSRIPPFSKGNIFLTLDIDQLDETRKLEWRYEEVYAELPH